MPSFARMTRDIKKTECVMSTLIINGQVLYTLELPDLNNEPGVSCIPTGFYHCVYRKQNGHGIKDVYEVLDVPGRSGIQFHVGNTVADTKGCILPGLGREPDENRVINSLLAINKLIDIVGNSFELLIEDKA